MKKLSSAPSIQLESVIKIVDKYISDKVIDDDSDTSQQATPVKKEVTPKVIISQSYV